MSRDAESAGLSANLILDERNERGQISKPVPVTVLGDLLDEPEADLSQFPALSPLTAVETSFAEPMRYEFRSTHRLRIEIS